MQSTNLLYFKLNGIRHVLTSCHDNRAQIKIAPNENVYEPAYETALECGADPKALVEDYIGQVVAKGQGDLFKHSQVADKLLDKETYYILGYKDRYFYNRIFEKYVEVKRSEAIAVDSDSGDDQSSVSSMTTQRQGKDGSHVKTMRLRRNVHENIATLLESHGLLQGESACSPYQEFCRRIDDGLVDPENKADWQMLENTVKNNIASMPPSEAETPGKKDRQRAVRFSNLAEWRDPDQNQTWVKEISDAQNGKFFRKEDVKSKWEKQKQRLF